METGKTSQFINSSSLNMTLTDSNSSTALTHIIDVLDRGLVKTAADARNLLIDSKISAADLQAWADYDHSPSDSYGRKLVHLGGNYELMVMSWVPGDYSAIHDHGATDWGAVKFFGHAEHHAYKFDGNEITLTETAQIAPDDVRSVDHQLIHQMGNPGDEPFLTLHLYGNHQSADAITGDARIFDLLEGAVQFTSGGVFYCLPQDLVTQKISGICGSPEAAVIHHTHMLQRVEKTLEAGSDCVMEHYQAILTHALKKLQ